jgi:predicted nucleic acid-binding protein
MIVFLDTNIVIYLIEGSPVLGAKAVARLKAVHAQGDIPAVNDLVRMECQVGPLMSGNQQVLDDYLVFFNSPTIQILPMPPDVFNRAARIRATYGFAAPDSLQLATAVEHGCGLFLTNDSGLCRFPDIAIEILA